MLTMAKTTPPVAERRPTRFTRHGVTVTDDYAWLRDAGYPEVTDPAILAHLEAENAWFDAAMAGQQPLIDHLFTEMRGRIKEAEGFLSFMSNYRKRLMSNGLSKIN